ncbi:MAG: MaoC family dehydratase [Pseudomonadales bacterium]|nr:MaoC family dehydratase [Pseudomonadales bacterium]
MSGKYFEELEVGMVFEHQPHRTITEIDNLLFSALTHNPQPLHLDAEFASQSQHGQILVNSLFTLGLAVGLSVADTTLGTTIGNLGMEKTEFPNPVFLGDTLSVSTEIMDKRESRTKPDRGIVWFRHLALNQRGEVVCDCLRKGMMLRSPSHQENKD